MLRTFPRTSFRPISLKSPLLSLGVSRWNATSGRVAQKCGSPAANYLRLQRTLLIELGELDPPPVGETRPPDALPKYAAALPPIICAFSEHYSSSSESSIHLPSSTGTRPPGALPKYAAALPPIICAFSEH